MGLAPGRRRSTCKSRETARRMAHRVRAKPVMARRLVNRAGACHREHGAGITKKISKPRKKLPNRPSFARIIREWTTRHDEDTLVFAWASLAHAENTELGRAHWAARVR